MDWSIVGVEYLLGVIDQLEEAVLVARAQSNLGSCGKIR